MIVNRPNQRVSISEKMKEDYYVNNMQYYISTATSINNKELTEENLDAANGIISEELYKYVLNPISKDDDGIKNLPGVFRNIDFITPIREKNIGEYIELPNEFTVKVDDPDITLRRNTEVAKKIRPIIEQAIIRIIEGNPQANENLDIEKEAKRLLTEWVDDRAVSSKGLIQSILNENDFESLRLSLYNNWWSTEEVYLEVYHRNGSVIFDEISPLEGYTVSNGYAYVDDHEAFLIKRKLTMDRIEENYSEDLSEKDREYLRSLLDNYNGSDYSINEMIYENIYGRKIFGEDKVNSAGSVTFSSGREIDEYVLYYKTESKRKILYYFNELGEVNSKVIEEDDFVFDEELGHIEIQKEWIAETWKQVLLGDEFSGIYLKPKPVEVQIYDARGHCKLPIVGKKGIINGIYLNPIPKRIAPSAALYNILTLHIERQIAKYKGSMEIIPQSLLTSMGSPKDAMFYRNADNTIIYDDRKVDFNTVSQGYRVVGNDALANYLKSMLEFRSTIKAEAWDMANMNDGRYGQAPASSTVTNNQQNIYNAKLGSILSVTTFNNILVRLYTMILTFAEYLYPEGVSGSTRGRDGDIVYYNIDEGQLTANKYGIYMSNSVLDFQKLKEYKDFAFAAGQHGEFELATAAIEGNSISAIRGKLNEYLKMKKEFEQKMEQDKLQQEKLISDAQIENDKANREAKLKEIELKETMITDRELKLEGIRNSNNQTNNK